MRTKFIYSLLLASLVPAQTQVPRDQVVLASIKRRMRHNLTQVPNYTCLETIDRGRRGPDRMVIAVPGKQVPFRRLDVVRLEIADIGGVEFFARVGAHNFESSEIRDFSTSGLMGNGLFSSFAHDVFLTSVPQYKFSAEVELDGRTLLRYDFKVPQLVSGYNVGTNLGRADVGYHGSFWADPKTLDAVRLQIIADDVPRSIGILNAENRVDYAIVRIGATDVLLPQGGELRTTTVEGWESRNQISFTHCKEYGVQSVIKFDEEPAGADGGSTGESSAGTKYVDLPNGLQLTLTLDSPVNSETSQVGDLLNARVELDAKAKNKVIVPKDAVVTGRLRRMEKHLEGWPYMLAGLEFTLIEFEGKQTRFFAQLEKLILPAGTAGPKLVQSRDLPGVGMVSAMGNRLVLPKGTRLIWKTISYQQAAEQAAQGK